MSAEIALVQEIEKYPCLYNSYLPEYNRKDLAEEAWAQVAHNNNLTVSDCKEKWRNIRCSFLRSLKPTTRYKKPYYLTAYLQFILPFMKSINNLEYVDELQLNDSFKNTNDVIVKMEPEEILEAQSEDENINKEIPIRIKYQSESSECIIQREKPTVPRRRKHFTPIVKKTEKKSKKSHITCSNKINGNALRFFLLSLLPELETMTDEQVRLFKIKAMLLIDEIKTNDTQIRQSINNINDSRRIQKRLINLLLKNVKKELHN
ncbi:hypothetical protein RR46_15263 [Papilio xuthus]|uniref:MADF domain-containing protein n=1 Tax=Papilio xuthus TaxID=66420 RepID=A0A194PGC8_PAPXU|nr:hypothetical protein RR46_15263 [Papilio xuthus]